MENKELSFGQQLVGLTFNPSGDEKVNRVKEICAELADIVMADHSTKYPGDSYAPYIYNLIKGKALGEILSAQMNVVKLLTLK